MPQSLSPEDIQKQVQELTATTTHPEFLKALQEVSNLDEQQRSQAVSTLLTPQALAARGVPIPQDLRITTRYFVDPTSKVLNVTTVGETQPDTAATEKILDDKTKLPSEKLGLTTVCVSIGYVVCASVGSDSVLQ